MAPFSDAEINALITCPKEISQPPAKALRLVGADWRNNAELIASDGRKGIFFMFLRRNDDLPENFSIGLRFSAKDGRPDITLLRCNGKHGPFTGSGDATHPHWNFHIHKASAEAQDLGFPAEKYASATGRYGSYDEAVQHFLKMVNLNTRDSSRHFPSNIQQNLFVN